MDNDRTRDRPPRFTTAALADAEIRVASVRGSDELGGFFEHHLLVQIDQDDLIDTTALLEAPAALYWTRPDGSPDGAFYGVVREAELLDSRPSYWVQYRIVLVSPLWFMTQTMRSRIFLDSTVPDIVDRVLDGAGLAPGTDYEWSLADRSAYPVREHVVQYQETDFDFVARLLEHDGIFWFGHSEMDHEHLVLADNNHAFVRPAEPEVTFSAHGASDTIDRRIYSMQLRHASVPQHLVTRDYDYRFPGVSLQSEHEVSRDGIGLVYLADDHPKDDRDVRRLARVRAEEIAVAEKTYRVVGTVSTLRAGQQIEIAGHHIDELNGSYAVVSVEYEQGQGEDGGMPIATAELIRASVPYRPPRITRRPRIYGILPGHVDGETVGIPAPLDAQGRYKVLLPFDSSGAPGGRASSWLRLAQTFAGPGYGMHFPLHVGTEVLIAHADGDPDRPLIIGAVPNPATMAPAIDVNATQSVVRTKAGIVQEYEDDARAGS